MSQTEDGSDDSRAISRRGFLQTTAGTVATVGAAAAAETVDSQPARAVSPGHGHGPGIGTPSSANEIDPPDPRDLPNPAYGERQKKYGEPGYPPIDAFHEIGRTELKKRKELGPFTFKQTLSPSDIGLESGGSFSEAIEGVDVSNSQIDLQGQTHTLDSDTTFQPNGTFSMKNGTLKVPGNQRVNLTIEASHAKVSDLTIDVTAKGAAASFRPQTDGSFQIANIDHRGFQGGLEARGEQGANYNPIYPKPSGDGHIKVEHYHATGGVQAAAHTQNNSCPNWSPGGAAFCYIGPGTTGTVDFVNCEVSMYQNAYYCSKTSCTVRIIGGKYVNNENATLRISAPPGTTAKNKRSRGSGCTIYYNQDKWPADQPGNPYKVGEIQGIQAMRTESTADAVGPILDHIDVHAYNVKTNDCGNGGFNGLFEWKDDVGGSTVENCRFTGKNIPPTPAIQAYNAGQSSGEALKSKYAGAPPQPWGIEMSGLEIIGDFFDGTAITIEGNRQSQSSLKDSCIKAASGPEVISGIPSGKIQNVGYGPHCKKSQMAKGKVGAPGKISSLPAPSEGNVSAGNAGRHRDGGGGGGMGGGQKAVVGVLLVFLPVLLILLILGGTIFGGLVWFMRKLGTGDDQ